MASRRWFEDIKPKSQGTFSQQKMRTLTERMTGKSKGQIGKLAPGQQTGKGFKQEGKGYVDVYNLRDGENTSKSVLRTHAETALGRELTKSEFKKLRARELKSGSRIEKSTPRDPRTGYKLNLSRQMTAFRITFS